MKSLAWLGPALAFLAAGCGDSSGNGGDASLPPDLAVPPDQAMLGPDLAKLPAPTLTSVSPSRGSALGATKIVLTGDHFLSGAQVFVDERPAMGASIDPPTQITALTPAHARGAVS